MANSFSEFGFDDEDALYEAQAKVLGHDYDYWKEKGEAFKNGGNWHSLSSDPDMVSFGYLKEGGIWNYKSSGLKDAYDELQPQKAKERAERETGEIASTTSDTAVRESTNALRSAGQSKGQAALGGGNVGAVTYGNTYINNAAGINANAMNKLYEQLAAQQDLDQMNTKLQNEENAQKEQLKMDILNTVVDGAKGFATGGWVGLAAGVLF